MSKYAAIPLVAHGPANTPTPRRLRFLTALYTRNFRYLWMGQLASAFVQRMGDVVVGWLILEMTRSPWLVGVVIALRRVGTLLGPWAGVLADRLDRRRLALGLSMLMISVVCGLASLVYLRRLEVWHLFTASILTSMLWAFYQPVQQSLQADVLASSDLTNGITLTNMAMNLTTIAGPAVAGLLLACCRPALPLLQWSDADMSGPLQWFPYQPSRLYIAASQGTVLVSADHGAHWGAALFRLPETVTAMLSLDGAATGVLWAFMLMMTLHTIQLVCYMLLRPAPSATGKHPGGLALWQNLREGLQYSGRQSGLWTSLVLAGLVNLIGLPLQSTLLPVFAREVFSVKANGLGWLGALAGAGAFLGSCAMIRLGSVQRAGRMMLWGTFGWSVLVLVFACMPTYELALVAIVCVGVMQSFSLTNMTIMLLNTSSASMRGRIMGLRSLAVAPHFLGGLLTGAIAEHFGAPQAAMACGIVGMTVTLVVAPWVPKGERR